MRVIDELRQHLKTLEDRLDQNKSQVAMLVTQIGYKEQDLDAIKEEIVDVTRAIQILEDSLGNADIMSTKSEPKL